MNNLTMHSRASPVGGNDRRQSGSSGHSSGPSGERVKRSLDRVLALLAIELVEDVEDEAMAELALDDAYFEEPLSQHEVTVLATALCVNRRSRPFDYNDVLAVTARIRGRAMNLTMVYKCFTRLVERRLIREEIKQGEIGPRSSRAFWITDEGREAFKMAVLNARLLKMSRCQAAA